MKIHSMLCLCAAVAAAPSSFAELPFSGEALGTMEATVAFCVRIDAKAAAKYQERATLVVKGLPQDEVGKIRDASEYKDAYESISTTLGKVSKHDAEEACHGLLETDS